LEELLFEITHSLYTERHKLPTRWETLTGPMLVNQTFSGMTALSSFLLNPDFSESLWHGDLDRFVPRGECQVVGFGHGFVGALAFEDIEP